MDESRYHKLADEALRTLESMLEDVDAEEVDVERAGDVLTLTFADKRKAVVNTQRPTRQIWLAADARKALELVDEPDDRLRVIKHRVLEPHPRRQHPAEAPLQLLVDLAARLVDGRDDHVLKHLDVAVLEGLGIDLHLERA